MNIFTFYKDKEQDNKIFTLFNGKPMTIHESISKLNSSLSWGYSGEGSKNLARAILLHVGLDENRAIKYDADFIKDFLSKVGYDSGKKLTIKQNDITNWIEKL